MAEPRLSSLFSPFSVKSLELKNRIIMAPMGNRYPSYYYQVTQRLRDYYVERAKGGAGLIIVQFSCVSPEGRGSFYLTGLWDDSFIPGFRDLVADIHSAGAKAAVQLAHAGATARPLFTGTRPVAPSAIALKGGEMPKALSTGEIEALVESFAQSARRARDAGFDAVEFHAAHGYLLNQFLSPLWNHREDRYGGSTENRTRIILEIVARTRELLGEDYPILVRLCADEGLPGGITPEEGCSIARLLAAGGVDVLDVTAGIGETSAYSVPSTFVDPGVLVPLATAIRSCAGVPVVAVGKLHQPQIAEAVVAEGRADLIALGRALIADPYWPTKAAEGRWDEIRPCLACAAPDCHGRTTRQLDLACVVNPTVGRERSFTASRVKEPKRVMVVGGGPAGMEAAMAAAARGHTVSLYEQAAKLGGQIPMAAAPPHKEEMGRFLQYMRKAVTRSGVELHLGVEATLATAQREKPDLVILAAGSSPAVPSIPVRDQQVTTAWDVLAGRVEVGHNVVIVGGGDVGCETAEYLAALGKRVTILEMLPDVASELIWWTHDLMVQQLIDAQVEILTNSRLLSAEAGRVAYVRSGVTNWIEGVDTVVFAVGVRPAAQLSKALEESGIEVRLAGDCAAAGNLASAVRQGFEVGISVE